MQKHIAANLFTLLIFGMIGVGFWLMQTQKQYVAEGPLEQTMCFRVPSGSNMGSVAERLAKDGIISSSFVFKYRANYSGKSSELRAGSFLIPPSATMEEITEVITKAGPSNNCGTEVLWRVRVVGDQIIVKGLNAENGEFTELAKFDPATVEAEPEAFATAIEEPDARFEIQVIEGTTVYGVVNAIKSAPFLAGEVTSSPREGSLAPGRYSVARGADRQALIDQMSATQAEILEAAWLQRDPETPLIDRNEALTLASIIEKETGKADERPLVASVFVNRLNKDIRLQTDPTVIYGITKGEGILGRGLKRSELDRATPYNTYKIDGLPPTPIANPGKAAIEAALNPATSEFIFFVADGTGGHAFAKTLREHNRNVAAWRKVERERAEAAQGN